MITIAWLRWKAFGTKFALTRDSDGEVGISRVKFSLWDGKPYIGSSSHPQFLQTDGSVYSERNGSRGKWRIAFQTKAEAVVCSLGDRCSTSLRKYALATMTSDEKAAAVLYALATWCPECGHEVDKTYAPGLMDVCWRCGTWVLDEPETFGRNINCLYRSDYDQ